MIAKLRSIIVASTVYMLASADNLSADTEVIATRTMSYPACVANIEAVSSQLQVRPDYIVRTGILTIARFWTDDGSEESILVTCSKLDRKMVVNRTTSREGLPRRLKPPS